MKKTLKIKGMNCAACASHVESAIEGLGGVDSCEVNLRDGSATVRFDENKTGDEDIRRAVEDAGYTLGEN